MNKAHAIDLQLAKLLDQIEQDTLKRATAVYYRVATYHQDGLLIRPTRRTLSVRA